MAVRRAAGLLAGDQRNELPETVWYTAKRRLLGPPMINAQLREQRLSKPLALGVLSRDGISSSAYGTEEILIELIPLFGLAAFALLMPMTAVILFVMLVVVSSTARSSSSTPGLAGPTWSPGRTSARGSRRSPPWRC